MKKNLLKFTALAMATLIMTFSATFLPAFAADEEFLPLDLINNGTAYTAKDSDLSASVMTEVSTETAVTSVSLNATDKLMIIGYTLQLIATVLPEDAGNKEVVWTSSDESVASVDLNGCVTAKAPGISDITVTTDDGGKTATFKARVVTPTVVITVKKDKAVVRYGDTLAIPAEVTNQPMGGGIKWTVEGSGVSITQTESGDVCYVKSIGSGTAKVTGFPVDKDGNAIYDKKGITYSDTQNIVSKGGFFWKAISFLKNIFHISRIIAQAVEIK